MNNRASLQLKYPLIVAPMAGGPTTVDLVVASSEAGAMGSLGAAYLTPTAISAAVTEIRARTQKPFSINLFVPSGVSSAPPERIRAAVLATEKFRTELALAEPIVAPPFEENFDEQFEAVMSAKPAAFSFVFGLPSREHLNEARRNGICIMGTATSLDEARKLADADVDVIVVQGFEAGGHRAIFDAQADDPEIGTFDLLRTVFAEIDKPVVAAGGIMTSDDIRVMLSSGAAAVQMGTAFLATKEAGTSAPYRRRLLASRVRQTKTTRAFSGRFARGIVNRFMTELDSKPEATLPFPVQNKFTRDLRNASVKADSSDFLSLWCGTGDGELWTGSAGDLIERLFLPDAADKKPASR